MTNIPSKKSIIAILDNLIDSYELDISRVAKDYVPFDQIKLDDKDFGFGTVDRFPSLIRNNERIINSMYFFNKSIDNLNFLKNNISEENKGKIILLIKNGLFKEYTLTELKNLISIPGSSPIKKGISNFASLSKRSF